MLDLSEKIKNAAPARLPGAHLQSSPHKKIPTHRETKPPNNLPPQKKKKSAFSSGRGGIHELPW